MTQRLLTAREVQAITGLSRSGAYELMRLLGAERLGRETRLCSDKLDAYIDALSAASVPTDRAAAILARSLTALPEIAAPSMPGVYAILSASGLIKIGRSDDVAARVRALRSQNGAPIKFLGILSNDPGTEFEHHQRWAHLRRHGEWFTPNHDLVERIARARGAAP